MISIEIAYALKHKQVILCIEVPVGATIDQALEYSLIDKQFPMIDLKNDPVGIFSKPQKRDTVLKAGDRIEIYRPLIADPKQIRRNRAKKQAEEKKV